MSANHFPLKIWILFLIFICVSSRFINFKKGFEYQYKYNSTAHVRSIGQFNVLAKIGYTNINENPESQEIHVNVYTFQMKTRHLDEIIDHRTDFSKWFSFDITPSGEIVHVYHPANDDDEAVAIKKGAAAMFACRLHHSEEVPSHPTGDGWTYSVQEQGHEGRHNATYTVRSTGSGHVFRKVRDPGHHPVKHASSEYVKTLHFDRDLGNIHTVEVEESFKAMHKTADGFDPFENTRPVKAVNNFTNMEYPELSAFGNGKLEFLTRHRVDQPPSRPAVNVMTSSIHIKDVKQKKLPVDMETYIEFVKGNLTCMREEPEKGSKTLDKCFHKLVSALGDLSDQQLYTVARQYLINKPRLSRTFTDRSHVLDAIGSMATDVSQQILLDLVLNVTGPDPYIVKRLLVHLVNLDHPPIDSLIAMLKTFCFDPDSTPKNFHNGDTYHRIVLTVGVVARRLWDAGRKEESTDITRKLENMIGLHGKQETEREENFFLKRKLTF